MSLDYFSLLITFKLEIFPCVETCLGNGACREEEAGILGMWKQQEIQGFYLLSY